MRPYLDLLRYFPSKIAPALIGMLTSLIIINAFSISEFGEYQLIISTINLIAGLCFPWLNAIILRYGTSYARGELFHLIRPFFFFSIIVSVFLWFFLYFVILKSSLVILGLGFLSIMLSAFFELRILLFRVDNRYKRYTLFVLIKSILYLVVSVLLIEGFIMSVVMVIFLQVLGLFFIINFGLNDLQLFQYAKIAMEDRKRLLKYGYPTIVISLFTLAQGWSGKFIVNSVLGLHATGIFAANWDLGEKVFIVINSVFILASSSSIIQVHDREGVEASLNYLTRMQNFYFKVIPVMFSFIIFIYPIFAQNILPEEYLRGKWLFPLLGLGVFVTGVVHRYSILLTLRERNDLVMISMGMSTLVYVILNYLLIPVFDIVAPGVAFIASQITYFGVIVFFVRDMEKPKVQSGAWGILVSLGIAALSLLSYFPSIFNSFRLQVFSTMFLFLVIYFLIIKRTFNVA